MKIKYQKIVGLVMVLAVLVSLVAITAVPTMADVSAVTVTANPATASSTAGYSIAFTTTVAVAAGGTVTVTFPAEVTLPTTISKSLIGLTGGPDFSVTGAPDPVVSGQQVIVTIPGGQTMAAGARILTISQAAGILNPAVAKTRASPTGYAVTVVTSAESAGTTNKGNIGIIPGYTISAITGGRTTPVTVTGKGWSPNLGITISGGLAGTGIALADGTFSLTAYPAAGGAVNIADGAGQTQALAVGGAWDSAVTVPTFTIKATVEVSPTSGDVGSQVTVKGYDFTTGGNIPVGGITLGGVAWNTALIPLITVDAYGTNNDFSVVLPVPATMPGGAKTVSVTDSGAKNATGSFTVNTPTVTLNPNNGQPNTMVSLTGAHFRAADTILAGGITFAGTAWNTTPITVDASGNWNASIKVFNNAAPGNNPVVVMTVAGTAANSLFAVGTRALTFTPPSGPIGTMVLVTGANMTPGPAGTVTALTFNGAAWPGVTLPITIDSQGNINPTSLQVPTSGTGANIVVATDSTGLTAVGSFNITQPTMSVSPTTGYKGDTITLTGSGWLPGNLGLVQIQFAGVTYAVAIPDSSGNFTGMMTVPVNAAASSVVGAVDIANNRAPTQQFLLGPAKITVSPVSGPVTTQVTVTGVGFQPQSGLQALTIGGTIVTPTTPVVTDVVGKFTATFAVPGLVQQAHAVVAWVNNISASTFFTITAAPVSTAVQLATLSDTLVRVWGYSGGTWYMYDPADLADSNLASLSSGSGYWINVSAGDTVVYGGFSKVLVAGWNLIGWP